MQTDKSGKLCPATEEALIRMGEEHTSKDREITMKEAYKLHEDQDHHTSQLLKCFRVGEAHGHKRRLRES